MNRHTHKGTPSRIALVLFGVILISLLAPLAGSVAAAQSEPVAVITAGRLNIRSGPGPEYPVVTTAGRGVAVGLAGRNGDASWLYLRLPDGTLGWGWAEMISEGWDFMSLPRVTAAAAPAPAPAPAASTAPTGTVRDVFMRARVNTAAGDDHGIVDRLAGGTVVELLGRTPDSTWLYILFGGDSLGWIRAANVSSTYALSRLPVPGGPAWPVGLDLPATTVAYARQIAGAAPASPGTPAPGTAVVNAYRLNVRSGAGPGYEVIAQASQGDVLPIVGRDSAGAWLQVRLADGSLGWVSAYYTTELTDIARVPVEAAYQGVALVMTGAVNIRKGPGSLYERVVVAYQGQYLTLLGRIPDSTWLKVAVDGEEGWVDASFIRTQYPVETLPVFTRSAGDF